MKPTLFFIIFLSAALICFGQTALPDSIVGKRAEAFLKMVNSKSDADIQTFLNNEMTPNDEVTPDERLTLFKRIKGDLSGAKLLKIIESDSQSIFLTLKTATGEFLGIKLKISPNQNNRISEIGLEMLPESPLNSSTPKENSKRVSESELIPSVEKYLENLSKSDEFSGIVLIAKNGNPIFQNAYGYANKEFKVPNQMDTKFNIGSLNKMFTALAIGMLADDGKLSFDDSIEKHLPDYPNKEAAKKATIYHLLTMSSGIGDIFGKEFDATPKDKLRSIADYLPLFASKPLEFEPGRSRQYSNGGFIVLGSIIEKVSGKSYYDFVRERIFKTAGMDNTDSYSIDDIVPNLVQGYTRGEARKGVRKNNLFTLPARGSSAGGGYSTAHDLLKFVNAVDTGKIPVPESMKNSKGIMDADMLLRGFRAGGGAMGINSMILSRLPNNQTVIVLSNYDPPSAEKVGRQISDWISK